MMRDILLFDLMGTVLYDPYLEALEAATSLDPKTAFALRDPDCWPQFELGAIDEDEFVRRFFVAPDHCFDIDAFHRARREGYAILPGMERLLDDLAGRAQCYLASNYPRWIDQMCEDFGFARWMSGVYASCDLGFRKPDPAFFSAIVDDLQVPAQQCLFIDDRSENCQAAAGVGMRVHVFTDAAELRERLRGEGLLGDRTP